MASRLSEETIDRIRELTWKMGRAMNIPRQLIENAQVSLEDQLMTSDSILKSEAYLRRTIRHRLIDQLRAQSRELRRFVSLSSIETDGTGNCVDAMLHRHGHTTAPQVDDGEEHGREDAMHAIFAAISDELDAMSPARRAAWLARVRGRLDASGVLSDDEWASIVRILPLGHHSGTANLARHLEKSEGTVANDAFRANEKIAKAVSGHRLVRDR